MRQQQEWGGETVQLATRIPKNLHIRVRVTALDEGLTLADWVSSALAQHLERCQKPERGSKRGKGGPKDAA